MWVVCIHADVPPVAVLVTLHCPASSTESVPATREIFIGCIKSTPGFVRKVSNHFGIRSLSYRFFNLPLPLYVDKLQLFICNVWCCISFVSVCEHLITKPFRDLALLAKRLKWHPTWLTLSGGSKRL